MIPINAYFIVGLSILLLFIGYGYKKPIFIIFASILLFFTGYSIWQTDFTVKVGEYILTNSSIANITTANMTELYDNTTGLHWSAWGIIFVLFGLFTLIDGVFTLNNIKEE